MSEPVFFPHAQTIALIADSHRDRIMLDRAVEALRPVDGVLLLGDCAPDADYLAAKLASPPMPCAAIVIFPARRWRRCTERCFPPRARVFWPAMATAMA